MDKMNQVSVTEFMSKSKEEMYDMAVEMVEKYNRLVDICNDSAERIAELIERHTVYTNALNKDIAAKAAKIDLMQKEIDGRKAGYVALKTQMDTKYISIEEHDMINKSLDEKVEIYEKEIERLNRYTTNLETENNNLVTRVASLESGKVAELEKELADCKVKIRHQKENLDGINKTLEIRTKENERLIAVKNNQEKEIEAHESENARLSEKIIELKRSFNSLKEEMANRYIPIETHNDVCKTYEKNNEGFKKQIEYLKKELNQTCTCKELDLKGHQSRETALVNALADKNDEIKELKTEVTQYKEFIDGLNRDLNYWKDQERIRTNQLRATESKVEELYKRIENLKLANRIAVNNVYGLASASIREEDDYGRAGFKRYIEHLIEEEERAVPERFKVRLNEEITAIFEKEEETEVKSVGRTSSGRYPWGAKVNDIPCGSDSIE